MREQPRQQIGSTGDIPHMTQMVYDLKAQGDQLRSRISVLEQNLDQQGQRSLTNWTGYSQDEYRQIRSKIYELDGQRVLLKREFESVQADLRSAYKREDAITDWHSKPDNQNLLQVSQLLKDPLIQPIISQAVEIAGNLQQWVTAAVGLQRPTSDIAQIQQMQQAYLQEGKMPSAKMQQIMQQDIAQFQQMQKIGNEGR
jgi:hypothetical protein